MMNAFPTSICTSKAFEKVAPGRREREDPSRAFSAFKTPTSATPNSAPFVEADYPDEVVYRDYAYPVYYELAPGEPRDGLTFACSLAYLRDFPDWLSDWLVPGYLREKVTLLIRSLPKEPRIACQPVERTAEAFAAASEPTGDLLEKLAAFVTKQTGRLVEAA